MSRCIERGDDKTICLSGNGKQGEEGKKSHSKLFMRIVQDNLYFVR